MWMLKMRNDRNYNNLLRKQMLRKYIKFHQTETTESMT